MKYTALSFACCLALGCGSVKSSSDGGDVDASENPIDASADPDAQTLATVTARVLVEGEPAENIAVMYHDADGAYLGSVLTNAEGEAVIEEMPIGGAVTAPVRPFAGPSVSGTSFLSTITDVKDGDVLTFGAAPDDAGSGDSVGQLTVNLPADAVENATRYEAHAGCGFSSTGQAGSQLTPQVRERCISSEDQVSALAYAEDDAGTRLAYSTALDVPLSGTRPDLTGTANLNGWSTDLAEVTLNFMNAPSGADLFFAVLFNLRGGLRIEDLSASIEQTETFRFANGVVERSVAIGQMGFSEASQFSLLMESTTSVATAASPQTVDMDLSSEFFGRVQNVAVAEGEQLGVTFDAPDLSCKGNDGPVKMLWAIEAVAEESAVTGIATRDITWFVMSPGDTASGVTLPELDPAVEQSLWPRASFLNTEASVTFVADSGLTYDDVRNDEQGFSFLRFIPEDPEGTRCLLAQGAFVN